MDDDIYLPDGRLIGEERLRSLRDAAEAWVRQMLTLAAVPCSAHAMDEVSGAVDSLVALYRDHASMRGGHIVLDPEGERKRRKVLQDLIARIEELLWFYAASCEEDEDDRKALILWLKREYLGSTVTERIEAHVGRMSRAVHEAMEGAMLAHTGIIPSDLTLAAGTIVGVKYLRRLLETEVTRGWQHAWKGRHEDSMFVHVYRGSSFDCPYCDEIVDLGWQAVGKATVPPLHPNCRCYAVYV